jgi:hypothetical protein
MHLTAKWSCLKIWQLNSWCHRSVACFSKYRKRKIYWQYTGCWHTYVLLVDCNYIINFSYFRVNVALQSVYGVLKKLCQ